MTGGFLLIGLYTRVACIVLSGQMAVAYVKAHAPHGPLPIENGGELAVLYYFIFLYLAVSGPGPLSMDKAARRNSVRWYVCMERLTGSLSGEKNVAAVADQGFAAKLEAAAHMNRIRIVYDQVYSKYGSAVGAFCASGPRCMPYSNCSQSSASSVWPVTDSPIGRAGDSLI